MWRLIFLGIFAPILISPKFGNQWKNKWIKKLFIIIQFLVLFGLLCLIFYFLYIIFDSNSSDGYVWLILLLMLVHLYGIFFLGFRDNKKYNKWVKILFIIFECLVSFLLFLSIFSEDGWIFLLSFIIQILWIFVIFSIIKNEKKRKVIIWLSLSQLVLGGFIVFILMLAEGFHN